MDKINVIKTCYSLLRRETPLHFDCGKICSGECCKGDENTGMILFPGEEKLVDSSFIIKKSGNLKIAICNGHCDRNKRPLSCRIYPFFPMVENENGTYNIKVKYDVRGLNCPICLSGYKINRIFLMRVRRVGKLLLSNEETAKFYKNLSDDLREIEALRDIIKNS